MHVRAVTTPQEIEMFFRHAMEVYQPNADIEAMLPGQIESMGTLPDLAEGGYRAAFLDGELVGGYRLLDRKMRLGAARLRTGCIGAVYTLPRFRNRGVARAMMLDAIDFTMRNDYALLLLGGIQDFYDKFGYVDIHAVTRFVMKVDDLAAFDPGGWSTRLAGEEDAALMLDFYERHFEPYGGSFERSMQEQRHRLRFGSSSRPTVLSLGADGIARGYIQVDEQNRRHAREVVAETWPAAANLLRYHAGFAAAADDPPDEVDWVLPPDASLAIELIRHLSLQEMTDRIHIGGWMARAANIDVLLEGLALLWEEKLVRRSVGRKESTALCLEGRCWSLDFNGSRLQICRQTDTPGEALHLTQQQFIQLCFAYPAAYVAADEAFDNLPAHALFSAIFAAEPFWIAGTDGF